MLFLPHNGPSTARPPFHPKTCQGLPTNRHRSRNVLGCRGNRQAWAARSVARRGEPAAWELGENTRKPTQRDPGTLMEGSDPFLPTDQGSGVEAIPIGLRDRERAVNRAFGYRP